MKKIILAFCSFAALFFAGCKSNGSVLFLGDWNLIRCNIGGAPVEFSEGSVSISADGKNVKVSGFSGVNRFSGSCKIDGNKFSAVDSFISTKMAGRKEDMEFERAFLASLNRADGISVKTENEKQVLCISNSAEKSEFIFERATINDVAWVLTAILKGDGVVSVNAEKNELPFLKFSGDGNISGFSGVNYFTMSYVIDENKKKLSFTRGAATLMASGSPEATELEYQFFENIGRVRFYSISGKELTIYSKDRKILFEFVKNPSYGL